MAMNTDPLVSIIVPAYNRAQYIDACLRSAIAQTYQNIEVIVVDNASTDSTWDIIGDLAAFDHRIRPFRNETNLGPVRNWERGLAAAKGDFAMFLWSDDLIAPTFVSKTVPWLLGNPDAGFVCTGLEVFFDNHRYRDSVYRIGPAGLYASRLYRQSILCDLRFPLSPGCALFRLTDLRRNLTLFIPNHLSIDMAASGVGADLLFYLKATLNYPVFAYVDESLAFFRSHSGSITKASQAGVVPLLYALTKTNFLENNSAPSREIRRHNAYLFLLLMRFPNNNLGLRRREEFYRKEQPDVAVDWVCVLWIGVRYLCHELLRMYGRVIYAFGNVRESKS